MGKSVSFIAFFVRKMIALQASFPKRKKVTLPCDDWYKGKVLAPGVLKEMLNLESWVKKRGDMLGADAGHLEISFYPNISKWGQGNVDFENKGTFIMKY